MNVGMLWLDADRQRTLEEKVQRAADYYQDKYGHLPELCYVNKAQVTEECRVGKISVLPAATVLRDHFWLGLNS